MAFLSFIKPPGINFRLEWLHLHGKFTFMIPSSVVLCMRARLLLLQFCRVWWEIQPRPHAVRKEAGYQSCDLRRRHFHWAWMMLRCLEFSFHDTNFMQLKLSKICSGSIYIYIYILGGQPQLHCICELIRSNHPNESWHHTASSLYRHMYFLSQA